MTSRLTCVATATLALALLIPAAALADGRPFGPTEQFERVATFLVCENTSCDRSRVEVTAAEIVAASEDGRILVYTDSPNRSLGFVDIARPSEPRALGALPLGGEPTSVAVAGKWALLAVNTSESFTNPSGFLGVFDLQACARRVTTCQPHTTIPLAGQPDSVAVSPDRRWAAIVIENERDEAVTVDGVEGGLPQLPGGALQVLALHGPPGRWTLRTVDLSGLSAYAPEDPEPEYVAINRHNVAAVTLQENNHVVLVHLPTARVLRDFPAGTVDLDDVDVEDDGLIDPVGTLADVPREPDAVAWLGDELLVTANEGDLFGGSRGFSIFTTRGHPVFDSGVELEHLAMAHGHYPEGRSDNKGTEPEGVAVARYGRFFYYPLDPVASPAGGFVGLSEVVALDDDTLLVLERDNQGGPDARIKRLYTVSIAGVTPVPHGETVPLLGKRLVRDLLPDLAELRGWLQEKVEGVAVAADGHVYIVTDNDGVDENTGETQFIPLGHRRRLGF